MKRIALLLMTMLAAPCFPHPATDVKKGLDALSQGRLEESEAALHRADFEEPGDPRVGYDLGIVLYRKRQYEDAARRFETAVSGTLDPALRSDILHNLGNARYRSGDFQRAIDAYKASLELREEARTRFNLEAAEKRLNELQEEMKKQAQQQNQDQKGQDQKNQPGQQGQQGNQGQQGQEGQDQKKDGSQGKDENSKDGAAKDGKKKGEDQKDGKSGSDDQKKEGQDQAANPDQTPRNTGASEPNKIDIPNGSESAGIEDEPKERKDLSMKAEKEPPPPPDASQKAKAMKNLKLNPYMVEKVLKDLEEREKEIQKRYRRDPQRDGFEDSLDPFFMSPDEIREFMERRTRPKKNQDPNVPDW